MAAKPFESRIQDLVYNVDVGVGLLLIKYGLYILAVLLCIMGYTATQFKGFKDAEAMDYSQLGRSVMEQKALVTRNVRPAGMWYLIQQNKGTEQNLIDRHPEMVHAPAFPMMLAAWFKVTGQEFSPVFTGTVYPAEYAVVILNLILLSVTGLLLYLLALRYFEHRVALLSTSIFFLSDVLLSDAISGTNVTFLTFLTMLMFFCATKATDNRAEEQPTWTWIVPFVLSVLICLLAFLTRYAAIAFLPALAVWYVFQLKKPVIPVIVLVVVFMVGASPWLVRNVSVTGGLLGLAPYTALNETDEFPSLTFERSLSVELADRDIAGTLRRKWLGNMSTFTTEKLPLLGGGFLMALFSVSFFYRFSRDPVHRLRWCLALQALLILPIAAFFGDATFRVIHTIWPFALLYGSAFFFLLLDRLQFKAKVLNVSVIGLFVFLASLPSIFAILPPRAAVPYPPYFPPFISYVSGMMQPQEVLCTDMPWATAWYGGQKSLLLPSSIDEFYEINDYTKRISGLYFTTLTRDKPFISELATGTERSWFPIIQGRIPGDFPLTQGIPLSGRDQVFLTDRARWEEQ